MFRGVVRGVICKNALQGIPHRGPVQRPPPRHPPTRSKAEAHRASSVLVKHFTISAPTPDAQPAQIRTAPAARPQAKRHSPGPPSPDLRTRSEPGTAARHSTRPRRSRPGRISAQHPRPRSCTTGRNPRPDPEKLPQLRRSCPSSEGPDRMQPDILPGPHQLRTAPAPDHLPPILPACTRTESAPAGRPNRLFL